MSVSELIRQIESNLSAVYYFAQIITILCLFWGGYVVISMLSVEDKGRNNIATIILAYPLGLALFAIEAYIIVTFAIPYNVWSASLGFLSAILTVYILSAKRYGRGRVCDELKAIFIKAKTKRGIITIVCIVLMAAVACLGIFSVTVSNDSMYNYYFYPRSIVYFGGLRVTFDTFLTDVGQGCALINTLPFLFNFNETFGIQQMLNFCFIGIFYISLNDLFKQYSKRIRIVFPLLITLLLMTSIPFVIISKWVLANDYFMAFMFFATYIAIRRVGEDRYNVAIVGIIVAALSIMRIEGGVYAALFVLCISGFAYTNKELGAKIMVPAILLNVSYSARIFLTMNITAPYTFLTSKKAVEMIIIMVFVLMYVLIIRGRFFNGITNHLDILVIAGLLGVNLLLLIKNPSEYLSNLKVFINNVVYNGGWGILPAVVLSVYIVCLCSEFRFGYWDCIAFSYLLYAVAITFMREDGLHPGTGDSGNRVLLQGVPFLILAAASHLPAVMNKDE